MGRRVIGDKIKVNGDSIREFYNSRAEKHAEFENEYTLVLLKDQDPDFARRSDEFEKLEILPLLMIDGHSDVLDVGCGMGRWADALKGVCGSYTGIDFSERMIELARNRLNSDKMRFITSSFEDIDRNLETECTYNRVIIGGTCMIRIRCCG